MARYAIVRAGLVDVAEWDGQSAWSPGVGAVLIELEEGSQVGPGWSYDGSTFSPPPAPPAILTEVDVAVGSATVALGIISSVDGIGFSGASRVAPGRARFFFEVPQPDNNYMAQVTVRNGADVSVRVNNQTTTYVEVKTNGAVEAVGFNIKVTRIQRS